MRKSQNRILECYLCHKTITGNKMSNLRRHFRLHGPFVDCYKCLECNSTFQNPSNFKNHFKRKHPEVPATNIALKMLRTSRKAKCKSQFLEFIQM